MSGLGKKYNILKAASWYTVGNILVKGVSFFVLPIFTDLMSTTEYGIYSVYLSYVTIFEVIILLGLSSTVRIAKFDKDVDFKKYMSTIICIPVLLTLLGMLIINGRFLIVNSDLLSMNLTLWNYLLVTCAFAAVAGIIGAQLVIESKYKSYMAYSCINTLLNVGISLFLCYTIYRGHDIHMARVIGQCASSVISCLFLLFITRSKPAITGVYFRQSLRWGIPLLFHTLATIILTQSDRIVIKYMDGYSAAGIYSVAVTLIMIPLTLHTSIENAWAPWFYKKLEEKNYKEAYKINNLYIIAFAFITGCFMIVSPEIIRLFTNKDFWDSMYCLVPLSISVFGEMLYCLPANIEYFNKKTTFIMWGTISATIINIILDIGFVYIFGYVGAAYATSLSKLLLFAFHYFLSKKIDHNSVFNNKIAICSIIVLWLVNFGTITMIEHMLIRWGVLFFFCTIVAVYCLIKKNSIMEHFKHR